MGRRDASVSGGFRRPSRRLAPAGRSKGGLGHSEAFGRRDACEAGGRFRQGRRTARAGKRKGGPRQGVPRRVDGNCGRGRARTDRRAGPAGGGKGRH